MSENKKTENPIARDFELENYMMLLFNDNQSLKKIEDNQKKLKEIIIAKLDMLNVDKYSFPLNTPNESVKLRPLTISLVERKAMTFDVEKVKENIPEAIEKTLTVDSSNMDSFKELLREFGLTGKQVNALVKAMNMQTTVNEEMIKLKYDKGEIAPELMAEIANVSTTSRFIKFT